MLASLSLLKLQVSPDKVVSPPQCYRVLIQRGSIGFCSQSVFIKSFVEAARVSQMDRSSLDMGAVTHQARAVQTSLLPMWDCLLSLKQAGKQVKRVLTERTLFLLHGADRNRPTCVGSSSSGEWFSIISDNSHR